MCPVKLNASSSQGSNVQRESSDLKICIEGVPSKRTVYQKFLKSCTSAVFTWWYDSSHISRVWHVPLQSHFDCRVKNGRAENSFEFKYCDFSLFINCTLSILCSLQCCRMFWANTWIKIYTVPKRSITFLWVGKLLFNLGGQFPWKQCINVLEVTTLVSFSAHWASLM